MASNHNPARYEMIEAGGRTVQSFGLNRLLGQIYTLLYLHPEPLSLDEIAEQLSVSKASVSISCRQLAGWGAVRQVWQRGDRRDYYTAESDFRTILQSGILESLRKKLDSAERQIERSLKLLEDQGPDGAEHAFIESRLQQADKVRKKLRSLIDNPLVRRL
jgi:DNA-binding transcriptional regulator GbsR (MarR family)